MGRTYASRHLTAYIQRGRPHLARFSQQPEIVTPTSGPLWLNRDGDPAGPNTVQKLFAKLQSRVHPAYQCSAHACRQYWITRALQSGMAPQDVALQAGVSIEVIMKHYYAAAEHEVLSRMASASPLDRLSRMRQEALRRLPGRPVVRDWGASD